MESIWIERGRLDSVLKPICFIMEPTSFSMESTWVGRARLESILKPMRFVMEQVGFGMESNWLERGSASVSTETDILHDGADQFQYGIDLGRGGSA